MRAELTLHVRELYFRENIAGLEEELAAEGLPAALGALRRTK